MAVFAAFSRTVEFAQRRPDAFGAVVLFAAAAQLAYYPGLEGGGLAGSLLALFAAPLFTIPALSLVDATAGASDTALFDAASERYAPRVASVVGANVVVGVVGFAAGFAGVFSVAVLGFLGLLVFVAVLLALVLGAQFVSASVVVDDASATAAVKNSVALASSHPVHAAAFAVVVAATTGVGYLAVVAGTGGLGAPSGLLSLLVFLAMFAVGAALLAFALAFTVHFYRAIQRENGWRPPYASE